MSNSWSGLTSPSRSLGSSPIELVRDLSRSLLQEDWVDPVKSVTQSQFSAQLDMDWIHPWIGLDLVSKHGPMSSAGPSCPVQGGSDVLQLNLSAECMWLEGCSGRPARIRGRLAGQLGTGWKAYISMRDAAASRSAPAGTGGRLPRWATSRQYGLFLKTLRAAKNSRIKIATSDSRWSKTILL